MNNLFKILILIVFCGCGTEKITGKDYQKWFGPSTNNYDISFLDIKEYRQESFDMDNILVGRKFAALNGIYEKVYNNEKNN